MALCYWTPFYSALDIALPHSMLADDATQKADKGLHKIHIYSFQ